MKASFLYSLLYLSCLTGCSGSLPDVRPEDTTLKLLSVELADPQTKAGVNTVSKVKVYVTNTDGTDYAATSSLVFTGSGGNWSSDTNLDITAEGVVYGCYPESGTVTNENNMLKYPVTVYNGTGTTLDFTGDPQPDYLYSGPVSVSTASRAIRFADNTASTGADNSMKHALAKVSFRINKSANVSEKMILKQLKIQSNSSLLQTGDGYMQLADGTLNGLVTSSLITLTGATELQSSQSNPNVTCLVAPMNAAEAVMSFSLTIMVGDETASRTFVTASVNPAVKWEAGNHYVYHISIDKMGGTLEGIIIESWQNDASQNTSIGI